MEQIMTKEDYEIQFEYIVQDYDKSELFSGKLCPDQYVCQIATIREYYFDTKKRKPVFDDDTYDVITENIPSENNFLLLVLESPHIAEYFVQLKKTQYEKMRKKPCPAMGQFPGDAGANIVNHTLEILGEGYKNHHLILMNAIPFQCSLGFAPERVRDEVFTAIWEKFGSIFFKKRLGNLLENLRGKNVLIVNACTAGNKKEMVQAIIDAEFGIIQLAHPSVNWNTKTEAQKKKVDAAGLYQ